MFDLTIRLNACRSPAEALIESVSAQLGVAARQLPDLAEALRE